MADNALQPKEPLDPAYAKLVDELRAIIPGLQADCPVTVGWSSDYKLRLSDSAGRRYLLRCSAGVPVSRRAMQAGAMLEASAAGMLCTLPAKYGPLCDGGSFILQTWLEGDGLEDILRESDASTCRNLGELAGRALRSVHDASIGPASDFAFITAARRIERHIAGYVRSGFSEPWQCDALAAVRDGLHLLRGRPVCLRHGDFHPGNMVLHGDKLGIIDFDRCDRGDPFDEFYKAEMFSRELSTDFVNGQLHAYFCGDPPKLFWKVLKLYLADVIMYSLVWALPFGEAEVEGMRSRAITVIDDFDSFRANVPSWYSKP